MRRFDTEFRDRLRSSVEEIEQISGVEIVATVIPRVFRYWVVDFILAPALAFLVLTVMFFIETEIHYVLIYFEVVGTFLLVLLVLYIFPGLKRMVIGQTRLRATAQMKAQSLFQKHRMSNTESHIGVLILFAFFERQAIILPDVGAEELVPPDEWESLQAKCNAVFHSQDIAQGILDVLADCKAMFPAYIPPKNEPFNELPDELWLH